MVGQGQSAAGNVTVERVLTDEEVKRKRDRNNATTGASAAGARALAVKAVAFYFRAPAKAFFRTRVDYLAAARAINPRIQAQKSWSIRTTTPGLLTHAIRTHGWRFLPEQVLPPLAANVAIGAVLYTSYLSILAALHPGSGQSQKRVYPPPTFSQSYTAGFAAGAISSIVAAPFDALQVRYDHSDMLDNKAKVTHKSMWAYGRDKLREIGLRGVAAGWSLSFAKDALGYGAFFGTFEFVKAQCFYQFVTEYYGRKISLDFSAPELQLEGYRRGPEGATGRPTIQPHWALEPMFLLAAGMSATVAQQTIHYPLSVVQNIHYARLETLDLKLQTQRGREGAGRLAMATYGAAYKKTLAHCAQEARAAGGWRRWLYNGFLLNTVRQVPSTSAGLIIFELFRRRYAMGDDAIRISKDGFEIFLA